MFGGFFTNFARAIAERSRRSSEMHRLMTAVLNVLDRNRICAGAEYMTIRAATGPTNGPGVEIVGIRSYSLAQRIPELLVGTDLDLPLLYRCGSTKSVFCGEYCSDREKFDRRAHSLRQQMQHEFDAPETQSNPRDAVIEMDVRTALEAEGFWGTGFLVDSDLEGTAVTVPDLPDEETAHEIHKILVPVLPDFALSARFAHENRWNVFFDDFDRERNGGP